MKNTKGAKMEEGKKYSWLTILAAILWICVPLFYFLPEAMGHYYKPKYYFMWYRPIVMNISYLPLCCSIFALTRIVIKKQSKGYYLTLGVLILSAGSQFFLYESFYPTRLRKHPDCFNCASKLRCLGMAFTVCENEAFDANEEFAVPANWCDLLILQGGISESSLYCFDSGCRDGESSYALNKNVIGKTLWDIPPDVVILFESDLGKDSEKIRIQERDFYNKLPNEDKQYFNYAHKVHKEQWNQIGGPEDIVVNRHLRKGCNILYSDGHVEFVKLEDISNLRWTVGEK